MNLKTRRVQIISEFTKKYVRYYALIFRGGGGVLLKVIPYL